MKSSPTYSLQCPVTLRKPIELVTTARLVNFFNCILPEAMTPYWPKNAFIGNREKWQRQIKHIIRLLIKIILFDLRFEPRILPWQLWLSLSSRRGWASWRSTSWAFHPWRPSWRGTGPSGWRHGPSCRTPRSEINNVRVGGLHSTEVTFLLHTQQSRVWFPVLALRKKSERGKSQTFICDLSTVMLRVEWTRGQEAWKYQANPSSTGEWHDSTA